MGLLLHFPDRYDTRMTETVGRRRRRGGGKPVKDRGPEYQIPNKLDSPKGFDHPDGKHYNPNQITAEKGHWVQVRGRAAMLLRGEIKVEDLTTDELLRGQFLNNRGTFGGSAPRLIPREMHEACIAELLKRGNDLVRESFVDAITTVVELMKDPDTDPSLRFKAATYIWERVAGKVPDKVAVAGINRFEGTLLAIVAEMPDEKLAKAGIGKVIPGEIVGDEDE